LGEEWGSKKITRRKQKKRYKRALTPYFLRQTRKWEELKGSDPNAATCQKTLYRS